MKCLWRYANEHSLKKEEHLEQTKDFINSLQIIIHLPIFLQKMYWKFLIEK